MADRIVLKDGAFSSRSLQKAIHEIEAALKAFSSTMDKTDPAYVFYCIPQWGTTNQLFSSGMVANANAAYSDLSEIQSELNRVAGLLDSGPADLIKADRSFRGRESNGWQRAIITLGGGIADVFKRGGGKTGSAQIISENQITTEEPNDNTGKSGFDLYRERVQRINESVGIGEIQHYQTSEGITNTEGIGEGQCNWVSETTIIQRIEGRDDAANCRELLESNPSSQDYYADNGIPMRMGDKSYIVKNEAGPYTTDRICELLEEHPEGIMVWGNGHWIVLTDYERVDDGIQFYANDGVNNASYENKGRIKLEETWFYHDKGGRLEALDSIRTVHPV